MPLPEVEGVLTAAEVAETAESIAESARRHDLAAVVLAQPTPDVAVQ